MAARVILAKPGLDGHDRGIKLIGMALRDAGAEVVYLGLRQSPERIARAAVEEDAQLVGVSVLSGVHVDIATDLVRAMAAADAADVPVVMGGTIPAADAVLLTELGIRRVYPVGTPVDEAVADVLRLAEGSHG